MPSIINRPTLSVIALCLLISQPTFAAEKPRGLPAEVVKVVANPLDERITAVGILHATETVMISPEQSGQVAKILFNEGEAVEIGQPLIQLNKEIYEAELNQAEAHVKLSQIGYERAKSLLNKQVGSQQTLDTASAELEVNKAQQKLAKVHLEKMTIRAPFSGVTGLRNISVGDYVNSGEALLELSDIGQLKADFKVPEIYLAQLKRGTTVQLQVDAFPGRFFSGNITAIAPSADKQTHSIQVRATIDNSELLLRPGLFVTVQLIFNQNSHAILIPEQAIIPTAEQFMVMTLTNENTVVMTPVTLGQRRPGIVEVTKGLESGDLIVVAGQLKLRPGMPVTPIFIDGTQGAK